MQNVSLGQDTELIEVVPSIALGRLQWEAGSDSAPAAGADAIEATVTMADAKIPPRRARIPR